MTNFCVKKWRTPLSDMQENRSGNWSITKKLLKKEEGDEMVSMGYDYWKVFNDPITVTVLSQKVENEEYDPQTDPIEDKYKKKIWMSDAPGEYFEMCDLVNRIIPKYKYNDLCTQNILVGGLGLGLIVFLLKLRTDIRTVTVVEISEDIIKMVVPYIRKFYTIDDVLFMKDDFLEAIPKLKKTGIEYDVIIADIWQAYNKEGREVFEKTKDIMEKSYPNAQHLYWLFQSDIEKCKDY